MKRLVKIVSDLKHFRKDKFQNLVVALGNFDGVHLGHSEIIRTIRNRAKAIGGTSAVFTFRDHPQRILHRKDDPPILTSLVHKLFLLKQAEVDLCFLIDFTIPLSRKGPEEFVREIFIETLGAREICLGFNARFGHDRSGDSKLMMRLAREYGFSFLEAQPYQIRGQVVSSSLIRSLIRAGKIKEAQAFLGRPYSFFGTVVSGSGRGKEIGFPTANLDPHSEVMPPEGVYATWVRILDCRFVATEEGCTRLEERVIGDHFKALLNYGTRPTFGQDSKPIPEVHILDFREDLVDKTVEVTIGDCLRPERAFSNREALREQIMQDIETGRRWFQQQT